MRNIAILTLLGMIVGVVGGVCSMERKLEGVGSTFGDVDIEQTEFE